MDWSIGRSGGKGKVKYFDNYDYFRLHYSSPVPVVVVVVAVAAAAVAAGEDEAGDDAGADAPVPPPEPLRTCSVLEQEVSW
jgi:hypothetical protein